jgi:hypothetical protein
MAINVKIVALTMQHGVEGFVGCLLCGQLALQKSLLR